MSAKPAACKKCEKSSLALLMLRPSPIAKEDPLRPPGSSVVQSAGIHALGLTPARAPTESRTVLRLMREGFVHVYIESPPPGVKKWQVYQVTPNADLLPLGSHLDITIPPPPPCPAQEHNRAGLMLVSIPKAHLIAGVWIAFSANYWNDKLRGQNAANPKVMQYVPLAGGGKNTFKPTEANLKNHVLECALEKLVIDKATDHFFTFTSVAGHVAQLAEALRKAATHHPKTEGKELAVVLADPVGYTTELNALRLRRHDLITQENMKPDIAWALSSRHLVNGLRKVIVDSDQKLAMDHELPVMSYGRFRDAMRVKPNPYGWSDDAYWEPIAPTRENTARYGPGMGFVHSSNTPYIEWARAKSEATWEGMKKYYDEAAADAWHAAYQERMKTEHYIPLERFEVDWWESRKDARFNDYFELHFDPDDPNDPKKLCSPGRSYICEAGRATVPAPFIYGKVLPEYLAEAEAEITKPTSVMLRALAANQQAVIDKVSEIFALDFGAGAEHAEQQRNDKLYDLGTGFIVHVGEMPAVAKAFPRYSWLLEGAGQGAAVFSLHILKSLSTAGTAFMLTVGQVAYGTTASAQLTTQFVKSGAGRRLLQRLQNIGLVQRAADLARECVDKGGPIRTPMVVRMQVKPHEALRYMHGQLSRRAAIAAQKSKSLITLHLVTDNIELATYGSDPRKALAAGAGRVERPVAALLRLPHTGASIVIADADVPHFIQNAPMRPMNGWARAAEAAGETARGISTALTDVQSRLAIGVILLNLFGLLKTKADLSKPDTDAIDACLSIIDSGASVLGGALQITAVVAEGSIARRLGKTGVENSLKLLGMQSVAGLLGAVAGLATAASQFRKGYQSEDLKTKSFYFLSGAGFVGTVLTSSLIAVGTGAKIMVAIKEARSAQIAARTGVARAAGSGLAHRLALRYGAAGAASLFGGTVTGWGLVFLGLAISFEVLIIVITPTEMQTWISKSRFGKGGTQKFSDWASEVNGLPEAFKQAAQPTSTAQVEAGS